MMDVQNENNDIARGPSFTVRFSWEESEERLRDELGAPIAISISNFCEISNVAKTHVFITIFERTAKECSEFFTNLGSSPWNIYGGA